jgi:hypothetical protein
MSQNIKLRVADDSSNPSVDTAKVVGKPNKVLPTVRVSFSKQMDIVRAYAAAGSGKAVTGKDVADIVQMAPTTISLANPFFLDVKFVQKSEGVGMAPASEVMEYLHAYEWDKETAAHKLSPLLSNAWFWEALQPRLAFEKLSEEQVITVLAEKSKAGPSYKPQLKMVLEFLDAAGMIKRENGQVTALKGAQQTTALLAPAAAPAKSAEHAESPSVSPLKQRASVGTNFAQREGVISFDISVRVDMSEFVGWEPARIAAFFAGVAQVISAKGMFEKDSVKE